MSISTTLQLSAIFVQLMPKTFSLSTVTRINYTANCPALRHTTALSSGSVKRRLHRWASDRCRVPGRWWRSLVPANYRTRETGASRSTLASERTSCFCFAVGCLESPSAADSWAIGQCFTVSAFSLAREKWLRRVWWCMLSSLMLS